MNDERERERERVDGYRIGMAKLERSREVLVGTAAEPHGKHYFPPKNIFLGGTDQYYQQDTTFKHIRGKREIIRID